MRDRGGGGGGVCATVTCCCGAVRRAPGAGVLRGSGGRNAGRAGVRMPGRVPGFVLVLVAAEAAANSAAPATGISLERPSLSITAASAAWTSRMLWYRLAWFFSRHLRITASYASGISGTCSCGGVGGICRWPMSTSPKLVPGKGSLPVAIWYIMQPSE